MKYPRLVVATMLLLALAQYATAQKKAKQTCEVKVELEQHNTSANQENGKITVRPVSGTAPYKYLFYDAETGIPLRDDFTKPNVEGLKKGKYICLVIDDKRCNKQIEFTIQ